MSNKEDYDLICQICLDMWKKADAPIKTSERVEGGRCWRCLTRDSLINPVYRLSASSVNEVKK